MKTQLLISLALSSVAALAMNKPLEHAPTKCKPVSDKMVNPPNSRGYYFDENCTAYVLPPEEGTIRVSPPVLTDSAAVCSGIMGAVNGYAAASQAYQSTLKEQTRLQAQIQRDKNACKEVHNAETALQKLVTDLQAQIAKIQADLEIKQALKKTCEATPDAKGCSSVDSDIQARQNRIDGLNQRLDTFNHKVDKIQERVALCEARFPFSKSDDSETKKQMEAINAKLEELSKKLVTEKTRLQDLKGGLQTSIGFKSGQIEMVQAYKNLNSGISFEAMPIKGAMIYFEKINDGRAQGLATVTRFNINGAPAAVGKPSETMPLANSSPDGFNINDTETAQKMFGGSVGGEISLNVYSACLLRENFPDMKSPQAAQAIASLVNPTVTYSFDLGASKDVTVTYNEEYLYQLIKESTTRGGFFWTSSSQSITERTVGEKWLKVEENWDDTDLAWSDPEGLAMRLRSEVLDAALGRVAIKTYDTPAAAVADGGTPPANGAGVAADNLRKVPNFYAQVAAIVLDIGNAVFGGSSSTGSFTRTIKKSEIQNLTINGMVKFWGSQSFKPAGM